jgi:putative restriction endonuclease
LIYFFGIEKGRYLPMWPVFVEGAHDKMLTFDVSVDEASALTFNIADDAAAHGRREYITSLMKRRVHQQAFREKVMHAYNSTCTLCNLRYRELLDAAHIISDKEQDGLPIVQNGLSLCKIHHAAFDHNIIGIDPDYHVHIQEEVLEEIDGPMLKYGLQSLDKQKLILPKHKKDWPEQERLERRYEGYLRAG